MSGSKGNSKETEYGASPYSTPQSSVRASPEPSAPPLQHPPPPPYSKAIGAKMMNGADIAKHRSTATAQPNEYAIPLLGAPPPLCSPISAHCGYTPASHHYYASALDEQQRPRVQRFSPDSTEQRRSTGRAANLAHFLCSATSFILAALLLSLGIICWIKASGFCEYHSAIWGSSFLLANALIGLWTVKRRTKDVYIAHLILSIVAIIIAGFTIYLALWNWQLIGTEKQSFVDAHGHKHPTYCVNDKYDSRRMYHMYQHSAPFDFRQCLLALKIGLSVNAGQFVVAIVVAILQLFSICVCIGQLWLLHRKRCSEE